MQYMRKRKKLSAKTNLFYEIVKEYYNGEIERRKEIDGKASSLINYVSIVTAITISLGTYSLHDVFTHIQLAITYFAGITSLLGSVVMALVASRVMKWKNSPSLESMLDIYRNSNSKDDEMMKKVATSELQSATKLNHKNNQSKAKYLKASGWLMIAGLSILAFFLFLLYSVPISPQ
jgi:hypothetical protein